MWIGKEGDNDSTSLYLHKNCQNGTRLSVVNVIKNHTNCNVPLRNKNRYKILNFKENSPEKGFIMEALFKQTKETRNRFKAFS